MFHSKTDKVNLFTVWYCTSRSLKTIMTALVPIFNKYNNRFFSITDIHGDSEFDKAALKDFIQPSLLHIYGREEYVGTIERSVRTVKEDTDQLSTKFITSRSQ